jgi:hypothetical protein
VRTESNQHYTYTLQSNSSILRGTQLICQKVGDKIIAIPISRVLSVRNKTDKDQTQTTNIDSNFDSKKATKGEIVKQLDGKLRTYQYQQEILSLETWASYRINRPTAQIQPESAKKA